MSSFDIKKETVTVPRGAGIEGLIALIRQICRYPRVQSIHIDAKSNVTFSYVSREGERALPSPDVEFETVLPSSVVRANHIQEIPEQTNASHAVASLFQAASKDLMFPIAFVMHPGSTFWVWHERTTKMALDPSREELYGFPLLLDDKLTSDRLVLCSGYMRGGSLLDTRKSYSILLPQEYELQEKSA